jgi:hypothetical protein
MMKHERPRRGTEAAATNLGKSKNNPNTEHKTQADQPSDPIALTDVLACLARMLPRLAEAVEKAQSRPQPDRLAFRRDELAEALGISARGLERAVHAGNVPRPDLYIGKLPLWRVESIRIWLESRGKVVSR